jgi:hypothetical protein
MKLRKLGLLPAAALAMTFAWAGAASAATLLDLVGPFAPHAGPQQSAQNPCIMAGTTCPHQPANFGYNNFDQSGNRESFDVWSTTPTTSGIDGQPGTNPYTVSQITDILGGSTSFRVAIDVNTAGSQNLEALTSFEVFIDNVLAYYFGSASIGASNNGNGYADWTLGDISLLGYGPNVPVQFHAVWTGNTDGAESFFIVSTNAIPEPETYAMMLVGFSLLGFVARRRKQRLGNVVPA